MRSSFASRLNRGYIDALEKGLLQRAVDLDLADVEDLTTRTAMLRTLGRTHAELEPGHVEREHRIARDGIAPTASFDPELQAIVTLRSRDAAAGEPSSFAMSGGLPPALVPHVIPLLAWNPVAEDCDLRVA